ncbi:MAG TPA: globin [Paludibacter sp.]|nr:globin [Paludibacter sp.]
MNFKKYTLDLPITNYKFGERPDVTIPDREFYKVMGEEGIRKLVNRHYELLRVSEISHLFPANDEIFEIAKNNSADFMVQICGGPDYYNQHRGRPMLANRHAGSHITPESRLVWLNCYKQALAELTIPHHLIVSFWNYLNIFSNWMVNSPE